MTEHAVVIAGGGPTGLMLAGELALAGIDVAIVERRASQDLVGSRAGGLHSRTIEVLDQRGIADRFLSQGQLAQVARFHSSLWTSATFPPGTTTGSGCGRTISSASWPTGSASWRCRSIAECEVTGFAQDDTGVDVALSDGQSAPGAISHRVRRRTQCDPQSSRHRVPRLGSDDELADRRGRDVRGAGMGLPPRRPRQPWDRQSGGWRPGAGRDDRAAAGTSQRAHAAGSQRGADRRIRDRLRDPQSHLDLQVHRHDPPGRDLSRAARPAGRRRRTCASPGGWARPQYRCAGCGESGMEAGPGGQADFTGKPPRYLSCRAPPGRCPRAAQHDGAGRASPHGRPHQGLGRDRFRVPGHGRAAQTIGRG